METSKATSARAISRANATLISMESGRVYQFGKYFVSSGLGLARSGSAILHLPKSNRANLIHALDVMNLHITELLGFQVFANVNFIVSGEDHLRHPAAFGSENLFFDPAHR